MLVCCLTSRVNCTLNPTRVVVAFFLQFILYIFYRQALGSGKGGCDFSNSFVLLGLNGKVQSFARLAEYLDTERSCYKINGNLGVFLSSAAFLD